MYFWLNHRCKVLGKAYSIVQYLVYYSRDLVLVWEAAIVDSTSAESGERKLAIQKVDNKIELAVFTL